MAQRDYIKRTKESFAERSNERLKKSLEAFSDEKAKEIVNEIFEAYADEDGESFFKAGYRDDTLYLNEDEEYVKNMEEFKKSDKAKKTGSVAQKLGKLKNFIPKVELKSVLNGSVEDEEDEVDEDFAEDFVSEGKVTKEKKAVSEAEADEVYETAQDIDDISDETVDDVEDDVEVEAEEPEVEDEETEAEDEEAEAGDVTADEEAAPDDDDYDDEPENEPTIVITSVKDKVKDEVIEEPASKEDNEMRREFFDDEAEVEAVPRRRRKAVDTPVEETVEKEAPALDDDEDEDELESERRKNKFGNFFKRKNPDPFDDDYDDEDYDDDDYFDDDDYDDYYEGESTLKKVVNIIVILGLICTTAFFAASNYTNSKKLESANSQIKELKEGTAGGSSEEINALKAQIDQLTAENTRLKNGGTVTEPTSVAATGSTGASSTTITGQAPTSQGTATPTANATTYTVKQGDTGSKICKAVYGQYTEELWNKILSANGMSANSTYHPGDVLQIPQQ